MPCLSSFGGNTDPTLTMGGAVDSMVRVLRVERDVALRVLQTANTPRHDQCDYLALFSGHTRHTSYSGIETERERATPQHSRRPQGQRSTTPSTSQQRAPSAPCLKCICSQIHTNERCRNACQRRVLDSTLFPEGPFKSKHTSRFTRGRPSRANTVLKLRLYP